MHSVYLNIYLIINIIRNNIVFDTLIKKYNMYVSLSISVLIPHVCLSVCLFISVLKPDACLSVRLKILPVTTVT